MAADFEKINDVVADVTNAVLITKGFINASLLAVQGMQQADHGEKVDNDLYAIEVTVNSALDLIWDAVGRLEYLDKMTKEVDHVG